MEHEALLRRVGERVRGLRRARGLTQRALGARAGVSPRFLVALEHGEGNISLGRLADVAGALGVSVAALVAGAGPVHDEADRLALEGLERRRPPVPEGAARGRHLALIGMRGAGKTTAGRLAAARAGRRFVQVDREVEARAGMALAEIFAFHGPTRYRELALEALRDLLDSAEPAVIEVGGSLVEEPEAMVLLSRHALAVWLRAAPEAHLERVRRQGDLRPMAGRRDPLRELEAILARRAAAHAAADLALDTDALGVDGVVERLVGLLDAAAGQPESSASASSDR